MDCSSEGKYEWTQVVNRTLALRTGWLPLGEGRDHKNREDGENDHSTTGLWAIEAGFITVVLKDGLSLNMLFF